MKHRVSAVLMVLSLLLALVSIAAVPMPAGTAVFAGVVFVAGKGPVFTFTVNGEFSRSDLKGGIVHVQGGESYDLDCVQVDASTVKCTAPKVVGGHDVAVTWAGSKAWTRVPEAPAPHCYAVYDWNVSSPYTEWVNYGTVCQEDAANYGDVIIWYNPGWGATFPYQYMPYSPDQYRCSSNNMTAAYYYPACWW